MVKTLCPSRVKTILSPHLSSFLEWKFPVFPPWQPSVLALTHYTCVRAPTSINPLLTGSQTYAGDIGLLGPSLFPPLNTHPWQSAQLIWPVMAEPHSEQGQWCDPCVWSGWGREIFYGGQLFPICQAFLFFFQNKIANERERYVQKPRQNLQVSVCLGSWQGSGEGHGSVEVLGTV